MPRVDAQCLDHGGVRDPGRCSRSRALCDYYGQLSGELCGLLRRDGSAARRFRPRGAPGRAFLRDQFDGARDVVHHERSRKDPGGAVAAFWRICCGKALRRWRCWRVVLQNDWRLALVSLTRAAVRAGADAAAGPAHSQDHAQRAGRRRGTESGAAGNAERPSSGEVLRGGGNRIQPLPRPRRKACAAAICAMSRSRPSPRR